MDEAAPTTEAREQGAAAPQSPTAEALLAAEARREIRRQIVRRHYDRNRLAILERKKAQREARRDGAPQRPPGRPRLERGAPSSGPYRAAPPSPPEGEEEGASPTR